MVDVPLRHRQRTKPDGSGHWRLPLLVAVAATAALLLAGVALQLALDAYRGRMTLTGLTDDPAPVTLAVAAEPLAIPANMMRHAAARRGGALERVDLIVHWPTLTGYSQETGADFAGTPPSPAILFATIAPRDTALDATDRLDAVYAGFFTGNAVAGPAGLVGRLLDPRSGYGGEVVYFAPGVPRPFVARCLTEEDANVASSCMRDVNFGRRLSLLYRFNRERLADWAALDSGLRRLAEGFLVR